MNTVWNLFIIVIEAMNPHNLLNLLFTISLPCSYDFHYIKHSLNIKYREQKYAILTACSAIFY